MYDKYHRKIDYLRISITDRCNLRCTYCMPANGIRWIPHEEVLSYEEIVMAVKVMARLGIRHVRLTGGEPLVRKGCSHLVRMLKEIDGIETVTLTSNGILLGELAQDLYQAGIDGVNVSLDTLDVDKFCSITRGGNLTKVLEGISAMQKYPKVTLKLNCVLGEMDWEAGALEMARLAQKQPLHVRFIEHMPIGLEAEKEAQPQDRVLSALEEEFGRSRPPEALPLGFGPGRYVTFDGFSGTVGFISAMSHKFCSECNRIRLTADGKLRLCLQAKDSLDIRKLLERSPERLEEEIYRAIWNKPREHYFHEKSIETGSMSQIGG